MNKNENEIITESGVAEEAAVETKVDTEEVKTSEANTQSEAAPKTTGDKLLLILGGAGIVITVAVIVFLLSFSFGSKDGEKDNDKAAPATTTPQQMMEDGALNGGSGNGANNSVEVTEGISEVEDVVIDSSCRDAVKVFTDCFVLGQTDSAEAMLPAAVWDSLAQSVGVSRDEFITVVKTNFAVNSVAANIGEGNTVTCDVDSVLVIEDASAEAIRNAISGTHGIDKSTITDVYAVSMVMEYTINGQTVSETDELFCVKIDGVWYLAERDCLAVYYMLTA